jgi:uncharacterized membrane protein YfcA
MADDYLILCLVALLAGAVNSIAGGGTLLTFPVLFAFLGSTAEAAVVANATNTVALVPAAVAALLGYRRELAQERRWVTLLVGPSLVGGLIGSLLLVLLPSEWFKVAVPWLILAAALLFALQPQVARWTGIGKPHDAPSGRVAVGVIVFQLAVAIYGGYFGAGMGILMLAALSMLGMNDIHGMNAVKSLLGAVINGTSVVVFAASGKVDWPLAILMGVAAAIGGYLGAHTARRVNKTLVRAVVVALGFALAAYYFYREFA